MPLPLLFARSFDVINDNEVAVDGEQKVETAELRELLVS